MPRSILRPLAALAALAGLAAYATIMLRGPQGITALQGKHTQIRALEEENAKLLRDIEEKKRRIETLTNDPSTQATAVEREQRKLRHDQTRFDTPGERMAPTTDGSRPPQP